MDPNQEDFIDDALSFDTAMKKKKKKKNNEATVPVVAEASVPTEIVIPQEQPTEEPSDFDDGLLQGLKKKKNKKVIAEVEPAEEKTGDSETPANVSLDDAESFRPERKKKRARIDLASFERELMDSEFRTESRRDEDTDGIVMEDDLEEKWKDSDREYTYKELLERAFRLMRVANPESGEKRKYTMIPPQVQKEGTKKTVFANFADICKRMRRSQDHVIQYIYSELGTSGSVDGNQRLIIKGRFMPNQIENVLRRYIVEYVTCKVCKAPDTILTKENRLMFMQCEKCGATRSVMAIKSGFSAQVDRRRQ